MPKPPILDTIDWRNVFKKGESFDEWIRHGENPEGREAIKQLGKWHSVNGEMAAYLKGIDRPVHVIAVAEDWCPDVVRHVPCLMKLAEQSDQIQVRFLAREDAPEVFKRFLTVGGEAIPKFIFLSDKFVECGDWGPMQADCREYIARGKACGDMKTAREKVFETYQNDPECKQAFDELFHLIEIASCKKP